MINTKEHPDNSHKFYDTYQPYEGNDDMVKATARELFRANVEDANKDAKKWRD